MTVKSNPVKCRAIRHNPGVLNRYAVETIMPWEIKKALGKTLIPITLKLWYVIGLSTVSTGPVDNFAAAVDK